MPKFEQLQQHHLDETENDDAFGLRNLTFHHIWDEADIPDDLKPLMDYSSLKTQCDQRHEQLKRIVNNLSSTSETERNNATEHLSR